jgi:selenide, water dikinase
MTPIQNKKIKLTEYSSGGGCGCKIPSGTLEKLLNNYNKKFKDKKLLVGNENSDDAAVYKINDSQGIVASTDFFTPIVDNPYDFGRISATNALSDIYAMGAKPIFALAILAFPKTKLSNDIIKKIMNGGEDICNSAGITIAGGHTIESAEPIYGLAVVGLIDLKKIRTNSNVANNDLMILTKPLGVGIISASIKKKKKLNKDIYREMLSICTKLNEPGYILSKRSLINGMTDITGFGLLGHLKEMCVASKKKAIITYDDIPKIKGVEKLIKENIYTGASNKNWLNIKNYVENPKEINNAKKILLSDPQTSGGLLMSCTKKNSKEVLSILKKNDFKTSCIIGEFKNSKQPRIGII